MNNDDEIEPALGSGLLDKLMKMQNEMKNAQDELADERVTICAPHYYLGRGAGGGSAGP